LLSKNNKTTSFLKLGQTQSKEKFPFPQKNVFVRGVITVVNSAIEDDVVGEF